MNARAGRPLQNTLFGAPEPAKADHRYTSKPTGGYAAAPGTGPEGETCGSCGHCRFKEIHRGTRARRFYKCGLAMRDWSASRDTDVLRTSPACRYWEPGEPHETTVKNLRKGWDD